MELVRPGDTYGQLLSPLTDYVVLCGDECPVTLRINKKLEHWRLLSRLQKLRYYVKNTNGKMTAVPNLLRDEEIQTLGADVGEIFGSIPTLGREIGQYTDDCLTHLRLLISGSELALIPFELLIGPVGYPGTGNPLLLQKRLPISITREIRWGRPLNVKWNRKPRILMVAAAPGALQVPLQEHVTALRSALDPWIKWAKTSKDRLPHIKEYLTILPSASIDDIESACGTGEYTHIHILAHGAVSKEFGQNHFGVVLCDKADKNKPAIVDSRRLAAALRVTNRDGCGESSPSVVTLSTCDSGNQGSVVAPGGSIAHALHASGIPWVFASQFPLTKRGSIKMTHGIYQRLLRGDTPINTLHDVRSMLYINQSGDHDWASLIAYASPPEDMQNECNWFYARQTRQACNVDLFFASKETDSEKIDKRIEKVRKRLQTWRDKSATIVDTAGAVDHLNWKAEGLGVSGATEKQLAELYANKSDAKRSENEALYMACEYYKRATEIIGAKVHWQATQYLSLSAVLGKERDMETLLNATILAKRELESQDQDKIAWAHGTLAELVLLGVYHNTNNDTSNPREEDLVKEIQKHLQEIVNLKSKDSFHFFSTSRQFKRYCNWWKNYNPTLARIAQKALEPFSKK